MTYEAGQHHRRSVRIAGYDYSQSGMYFVTVCAADRACMFGEVVGGGVRLNDAGRIVEDEWAKTAQMRPRVLLDQFVVMPNHIHGIVVLMDSRGTLQRAPTGDRPIRTIERFGKPTRDSIPTIIRLFKAATTKRISIQQGTPGVTVWQRNYYEHIIRDGKSLDRIRRYIAENPVRWAFDRENPQAVNPEPEDAWRTLDRNEDGTR